MSAALTRKYATIEAEAERLAVSTRHIRRMIAAGEIKGYRLGKRMIRVDPTDLDAALRRIPTAGDVA